MGNANDERFLAICANCGAAFAGMTVSDGNIQAIGCREGCASCGSTDFSPVSASSGDLEFEAAVPDD